MSFIALLVDSSFCMSSCLLLAAAASLNVVVAEDVEGMKKSVRCLHVLEFLVLV